MASTYLTRTPGTGQTSRTKGTLSVWLKRAKTDEEDFIFYGYEGSANRMKITFLPSGKLQINSIQAGSNHLVYETNRLFRDTSAWYHIVIAIDTTLATAGDRCRLYVNGVEETSFSTETHFSQNDLHFLTENNIPIYIGSQATGNYFDGSMSHFHLIDGTQYQASDFGEYDANGVWKIKTSPSVTYGNHGFFILKDGNSVTDQSGQSNNLTVGGGTLTNTEDCPSNVFATMNPLDNGQAGTTILLANGNNTFMANSGSGDYGLKSTLGVNSGKYYWEFKDMAQGQTCGTCEMDMRIVINKNGGAGLDGGQNWTVQRYSSSEMNIYNNGTYSRVSTLWGGSNSGDIYSIALDCDNGKIFMQKNGGGYKDLSGNTGDPVNGTNPTFSGLATDGSKYYGAWTENRGNADNSCHYNFGNGYFGTTAVASAGTNASGNGIFEYDVPTGYTALSTKGLNL